MLRSPAADITYTDVSEYRIRLEWFLDPRIHTSWTYQPLNFQPFNGDLFLLAWYLYKIEKNEMGGACSTNGERRGLYRVFVGKPEGKRPLGRPRRRWENNIKSDIKEVGWRSMVWIDLAEDRDRWRALVNAVMNLRVP